MKQRLLIGVMLAGAGVMACGAAAQMGRDGAPAEPEVLAAERAAAGAAAEAAGPMLPGPGGRIAAAALAGVLGQEAQKPAVTDAPAGAAGGAPAGGSGVVAPMTVPLNQLDSVLPPAPGGPAAADLPAPRPANMAPSAQNKPMEGEMTPELDEAVRRGLAALVEMQNDDGSFGGGRFNRNVAITALGGLALMADGHLPGRGQYGPNVERALRNVLDMSTEIGLITGDAGNGPMYGHGFATLFLGEVHGMTGGDDDSPLARRTHEALIRACRLIERTQNEEGGWRYNPVPNDADVSVTITQIMALRSARNAGIEVPKAVIDKAVEYVKKCQNPDGGFMYQTPAGISAWPRSAAGVASLYYAGIYEGDAVTKGLGYLMREAMPENRARSDTHYWYGMYYTSQSMYLAGGQSWETFWPQSRREMLRSQNARGVWNDPGIGQAYGTSMALIVLQMPKRYLPIFQK